MILLLTRNLELIEKIKTITSDFSTTTNKVACIDMLNYEKVDILIVGSPFNNNDLDTKIQKKTKGHLHIMKSDDIEEIRHLLSGENNNRNQETVGCKEKNGQANIWASELDEKINVTNEHKKILVISNRRENIVKLRESLKNVIVVTSQQSANVRLQKNGFEKIIYDLEEALQIETNLPVLKLDVDINIEQLLLKEQEKATIGIKPVIDSENTELKIEKTAAISNLENIEQKEINTTYQIPKKEANKSANTIDKSTVNCQENLIIEGDGYNAIGVKHDFINDYPDQEEEIQTEEEAINNEGFFGKIKKAFKTGEGDNFFTSSLNIPDPKHKSKAKIMKIYQNVAAIIGTKGGTGKTSFALNLALAAKNDSNTIIIDLNFQDGGSDLSFITGLPQTPNLLTFIHEKNLSEAVSEFQGIFILQAPPVSQIGDKITTQELENIIRAAVREYDLVILDLPHIENSYTRVALEQATVTVIMTEGKEIEMSRINKKMETAKNPIIIVNKNEKTTIYKYFKVPWVLPYDKAVFEKGLGGKAYSLIVEKITEKIMTQR